MSELHHRYHEQLRTYWDKLRGERQYPNENEIDPDEIKELWPSCFLISLDDVVRRLGYRYSYLGEDLIEAYGDDMKNPDVALRLLSTASIPLVHKFDDVVKNGNAVIDEDEFVNVKNLKVKYRACMLPLGFQGNHVSHILGCMRWKVY